MSGAVGSVLESPLIPDGARFSVYSRDKEVNPKAMIAATVLLFFFSFFLFVNLLAAVFALGALFTRNIISALPGESPRFLEVLASGMEYITITLVIGQIGGWIPPII